MSPLIKYTGSCHCESVKYEVIAPAELQAFQCSCSICHKKQMPHFFVPASSFNLLTGHKELTTYTFGTHQAKHLFCSKCGVQSFFIPRCSQEAMAIVAHCVDSPLPLKINTVPVEGENYEEAMGKLNIVTDNASSHM